MFRDFPLLGFFWNGRNSSTSTQPNNLWVVANQNYNHPPSKTSKILIKLHLRAALDQFIFLRYKNFGDFSRIFITLTKNRNGGAKNRNGRAKNPTKNLKNQNLWKIFFLLGWVLWIIAVCAQRFSGPADNVRLPYRAYLVLFERVNNVNWVLNWKIMKIMKNQQNPGFQIRYPLPILHFWCVGAETGRVGKLKKNRRG